MAPNPKRWPSGGSISSDRSACSCSSICTSRTARTARRHEAYASTTRTTARSPTSMTIVGRLVRHLRPSSSTIAPRSCCCPITARASEITANRSTACSSTTRRSTCRSSSNRPVASAPGDGSRTSCNKWISCRRSRSRQGTDSRQSSRPIADGDPRRHRHLRARGRVFRSVVRTHALRLERAENVDRRRPPIHRGARRGALRSGATTPGSATTSRRRGTTGAACCQGKARCAEHGDAPPNAAVDPKAKREIVERYRQATKLAAAGAGRRRSCCSRASSATSRSSSNVWKRACTGRGRAWIASTVGDAYKHLAEEVQPSDRGRRGSGVARCSTSAEQARGRACSAQSAAENASDPPTQARLTNCSPKLPWRVATRTGRDGSGAGAEAEPEDCRWRRT